MNYQFKKPGSIGNSLHPFVCHLLPLIRLKHTSDIPNVYKKTPLVGYRGFTLIELVITLTIATVLVALAAPGLKNLVSDSRLVSQVNDLTADINVTKNEAIKRNTTGGVCPTVNGTSCASGGNWANGWFVYIVCPTNDSSCASGAIVPIKRHEALTGGITLSVSRTDSGGSLSTADLLTFGGNGILIQPTTTTYTYRFTLCDAPQKKTRIIDVTIVGQSTISTGAC